MLFRISYCSEINLHVLSLSYHCIHNEDQLCFLKFLFKLMIFQDYSLFSDKSPCSSLIISLHSSFVTHRPSFSVHFRFLQFYTEWPLCIHCVTKSLMGSLGLSEPDTNNRESLMINLDLWGQNEGDRKDNDDCW